MKLSHIFAFLAVLAAGVGAIATTTYAQQDDNAVIPDWIRNTALFWGQGDINDSEFVGLLQWLVDREIITIPGNNGDSELVRELQDEISGLKASIATDVRAAYEEGYADGQQDRKRDVHDDDDDDIMETLTIQTNKAAYNYGDEVIFKGTLYGAPDGTPITVVLTNDDSGNIVFLDQINLIRGKFEGTSYLNPSVHLESGSHTLKAMHGNNLVATATFDVTVPGVTIEPAYGSFTPGCEETVEGCYIPSVAIVDLGSTVLFSNTDTAAHTFTSGNTDDDGGANGFFDTGLMMSGSSFEWHPPATGEYEYYCLVHPWMTGLIVVQ